MRRLHVLVRLSVGASLVLFACKESAAAHPPAGPAAAEARTTRSVEQRSSGPFANLRDPAEGVTVRVRRYEEARYLVAVVDLRQNTVGLSGQTQGSARRFAELGEDVSFATNAGMFHQGYAPVGLHIEDGTSHGALNLEDAPGNFFMKPNGVFFVRGGAAAVQATERFASERSTETDDAAETITVATQSGPMLVIDGALHPRFLPESDSLYVRSGVGVRDAQTVVFVLSLDEVRFHDLATLFRDELGCQNALYLDGDISAAYVRGQPRLPNAWRSFGGLLTVRARTP